MLATAQGFGSSLKKKNGYWKCVAPKKKEQELSKRLQEVNKSNQKHPQSRSS